MVIRNRRELFSDTAKGMLLAGLGLSVSRDLGLAPAWAAEEPARLTFGSMEPLVEFLAQTPPDKIISACVGKIRSGTSLRELVAGAALAPSAAATSRLEGRGSSAKRRAKPPGAAACARKDGVCSIIYSSSASGSQPATRVHKAHSGESR